MTSFITSDASSSPRRLLSESNEEFTDDVINSHFFLVVITAFSCHKTWSVPVNQLDFVVFLKQIMLPLTIRKAYLIKIVFN